MGGGFESKTFDSPPFIKTREIIGVRTAVVKGKTYKLPKGLSLKKAKEVLMFELPVEGKTSIFNPVTRIGSINWDHGPVCHESLGLRLKSCYASNGNLVWGENFGESLNKVVEGLKILRARASTLRRTRLRRF